MTTNWNLHLYSIPINSYKFEIIPKSEQSCKIHTSETWMSTPNISNSPRYRCAPHQRCSLSVGCSERKHGKNSSDPEKNIFFKKNNRCPASYRHILRINIVLYRFEFEYFFIYKTYRSVCDLVPGSICTPDSCTENRSSDSQKNMAFLSWSQQMPGILKDSKGFQHDVLLKRHQRWSSQELQNGNDDIYFIRTFQPNVICL